MATAQSELSNVKTIVGRMNFFLVGNSLWCSLMTSLYNSTVELSAVRHWSNIRQQLVFSVLVLMAHIISTKFTVLPCIFFLIWETYFCNMIFSKKWYVFTDFAYEKTTEKQKLRHKETHRNMHIKRAHSRVTLAQTVRQLHVLFWVFARTCSEEIIYFGLLDEYKLVFQTNLLEKLAM